MKDIKIGNVRPIAEPRAPEKSTRKAPVQGPSFSKTLERAVTEMNEVSRQSGPAAASSDTKAIQAGIAAANKHFDTLKRVELQLREHYQNITRKPSQGDN